MEGNNELDEEEDEIDEVEILEEVIAPLLSFTVVLSPPTVPTRLIFRCLFVFDAFVLL